MKTSRDGRWIAFAPNGGMVRRGAEHVALTPFGSTSHGRPKGTEATRRSGKLVQTKPVRSAGNRISADTWLWAGYALRLRVDAGSPPLEQRLEPASYLGPLPNQILPLPGVGAEVEQHRPPAVDHQLPLPRADR